MPILAQLRRWLSGNPKDYRDEVATLLLAAEEDAAFRQRLLALLRLPIEHRTSLIHTALHEMTLRGEPQALRTAFAILATEEGAQAALRVLEAKY